MTPRTKRVVLVGAGHTHALFLQSLVETPLIKKCVVEQPLVYRPGSQQQTIQKPTAQKFSQQQPSDQSQQAHHQFVNNPFQNIEILLISPLSLAPYSGMIPGWLAGQYEFNETVVDFDVLCKRVGAKWIKAEMLGLDPDAQTINLSTGETLSYDWLSINVGSTLRPPEALVPNVLALRPLWTLRQRYNAYLESWLQDHNPEPLTVTTVGAGAAGVESLLCILQRLRSLRPNRLVQGRLISRSADILPGFSAQAKRLAHKALNDAQITIQCNADWQNIIAVSHHELSSNESDNDDSSTDLVIWATGAQAHSWQLDPTRRLTLQVSADGFIQVDNTLRSISHPNIFATGDCANLPSSLPKAGVYAVRMADTLIVNLRVAVNSEVGLSHHKQRSGQTHEVLQVNSAHRSSEADKPNRLGQVNQVDPSNHTDMFKPFKTKPYALALLNTGDGCAIASWRFFGMSGKLIWKLKDYIDRRFVNRFSN